MKHLTLISALLLLAPFFVNFCLALQVDPGTYDFGTLTLGETGSREFRLSNREEDDVRLSSISLAGDSFFQIVINTCDALLREKENCRVQVEFTPMAVGSRSAELTIVSDDPQQPEIIVPLQGVGGGTDPTDPPTDPTDPVDLSGIQVRDSVEPFDDHTIPFGEVPIGLAKRKIVQLINRNAEEIEIVSLTAPGAPFSIENDRCTLTRLPYLYSCTVEVVFTPSAISQSSDTLIFNTTAIDQPTISLGLSGSGIPETTDFPAPVLIYPENGQRDMKDSVLFRWSNCRDSTGKLANYRLHLGKQPLLPEAPARRIGANFVAMGCGLGGLLLLWRRKNGRWLLPVLVAAALFVVACSDDIEDSSLTTVSELEDETTYYWQVVAEYDDGIEEKSVIQSFRTR